MTRRHTCDELGVCRVEAACFMDKSIPDPCAQCSLAVKRLVDDGATFAVEVYDRAQSRQAAAFPFAPGTIEIHRPRAQDASGRVIRLLRFFARSAAHAGLIGLIIGYARGKGWL